MSYLTVPESLEKYNNNYTAIDSIISKYREKSKKNQQLIIQQYTDKLTEQLLSIIKNNYDNNIIPPSKINITVSLENIPVEIDGFICNKFIYKFFNKSEDETIKEIISIIEKNPLFKDITFYIDSNQIILKMF